MTKRPSGLRQSEAIFARNLFGATPAEAGQKHLYVLDESSLASTKQRAEQYEPGDVVHYSKGSKIYGIEAGEYARVELVNVKENVLTVKRRNGEHVSSEAISR
jgi:hypothetical protein